MVCANGVVVASCGDTDVAGPEKTAFQFGEQKVTVDQIGSLSEDPACFLVKV
jgi:hypothetical protein